MIGAIVFLAKVRPFEPLRPALGQVALNPNFVNTALGRLRIGCR